MFNDDHNGEEERRRATESLASSLETELLAYARRRRGAGDRRTAMATRVVAHLRHALRRCATKRRSLERGVEALERCSRRCAEAASRRGSDDERRTAVLGFWFRQYLRLRDGAVLLQSGECRHEGDVRESASTPHKSRLRDNDTRSDGYTSLFSAAHYSGYGWDEFFDERRGLLGRLRTALAAKRELPAMERLESFLDAHENALREANERLERARTGFLRLLREGFARRGDGDAATVRMRSKDKFERLEVSFVADDAGRRANLVLERRGNAWRVTDERGALPDDGDAAEWESIMTMEEEEEDDDERAPTRRPTAPSRKRKVVFDDDDDDDGPPTPDDAPGLKIALTSDAPTSSERSSSLAAIKQGMGVDDQALSESRRVLEEEQQRQPPEDPESKERESTAIREVVVATRAEKTWRTVAERVRRVEERDDLRDGEVDFEESWTARESHREALMTLGNALLRLADERGRSASSSSREAESCFRRALAVVGELEVLSERRREGSAADAAWLRRALLLLRARATVNAGIAALETYRAGRTDGAALRRATDRLRDARRTARTAREAATAATDAGADERRRDAAEAHRAERLADRWHTVASYHAATERDDANDDAALRRLEAALAASPSDDDDDLRRALGDEHGVHVLAERYADRVAWIDAVASEADHHRRRGDRPRGAKFQGLVARGYEDAASLSDRVRTVADPRVLEERGVLDASALLAEARRATGRLRDDDAALSTGATRSAITTTRPRPPRRGDLGEPRRGGPPTGHLTHVERAPPPRRPANDADDDADALPDNVMEAYFRLRERSRDDDDEGAEPPTSSSPNPVVEYRKWGDELLTKGRPGSDGALAWPACAPERPPCVTTT